MVGEHQRGDAELPCVVGEQRDVAQRVVFALASGSDVCYGGEAARLAEARGFCQVVVFLFRHVVEDAAASLLQFGRQRVAVAHYGIGVQSAGERLACGAVATAQVGGALERLERYAVGGVVAGGEYHRPPFINFHI